MDQQRYRTPREWFVEESTRNINFRRRYVGNLMMLVVGGRPHIRAINNPLEKNKAIVEYCYDTNMAHMDDINRDYNEYLMREFGEMNIV